MTICIVLTILIILGIILCCQAGGELTGFIGFVFVLICSVLLFTSIGEKINHHFKTHANISKFLVTKTTVEQARHNGMNLENVAIKHKIIESNQWLAQEQYYNASIWGWWIPDEVNDLKPIK